MLTNRFTADAVKSSDRSTPPSIMLPTTIAALTSAASDVNSGSASFSLEPGIYIVKINDTVKKVSVR